MINYTKTKALELIKNRYDQFSELNFNLTNISEKQYNFEIEISDYASKLKLLVYFGKKGVREVIQGNAQTELYSRVNSLITGETTTTKIESLEEPGSYIGCDETGKGDYFGPLIICAVYLDDYLKAKLDLKLIRDSKELSEFAIMATAGHILDRIGNNYEIKIVEPEEYNSIYEEERNLNKLLDKLHSEALFHLLKRVNPELVIVDRFSKTRTENINKVCNGKTKVRFVEKAEKYPAVAAASIIARYHLNLWFNDKLNAGLELPKGAGANVEKVAREVYNTFGKNEFVKLTKQHFKTTTKLGLL
ncbi:MAG: ribonuclease HIII [Melioribacteraceae bacterium]|nr:ribonuclease HIII [Melioribacteraceae bacterium]MCF8432691.1 ribonuclease HIII [Melioribacteraceae bacterium]